jgi:hypothetical protein
MKKWEENVRHVGEMKNVHKRQLGRLRHRWKDNIKLNIKE